MPERFDDMRAALYADAGEVGWADPADVRRRGTRRTHRRLAVTGLVTALLIGGGVGAGAVLIDDDTPTPPPPVISPTPSPSTTPSSPPPSGSPDPSGSRSPSGTPPADPEPTVDVPGTALLQPRDIGAGYRADDGRGLEDARLGWLFSAVCEAGDWTDTYDHRVGYGNQTAIRHPDREGDWTGQIAERYDSVAKAREFLSDVIATTDRCRRMKTSDGGEIRLVMVDHGFAGDASILVRVDPDDRSGIRYYVFVRQGALVSEIMLGPDAREGAARTVAERAAARMCHATPTC